MNVFNWFQSTQELPKRVKFQRVVFHCIFQAVCQSTSLILHKKVDCHSHEIMRSFSDSRDCGECRYPGVPCPSRSTNTDLEQDSRVCSRRGWVPGAGAHVRSAGEVAGGAAEVVNGDAAAQ